MIGQYPTYQTKVATTPNFVHIVVPNQFANQGQVPHGIYSMPINTWEAIARISVRMHVFGLIDYQVEPRVWQTLLNPEQIMALLNADGGNDRSLNFTYHHGARAHFNVMHPTGSRFFWAMVVADQSAEVNAPHPNDIANNMNAMLRGAVNELTPQLLSNFHGDMDINIGFPGLHTFLLSGVSDRYHAFNQGPPAIEGKADRVNPQPASEFITDRPLKDIAVLLCKMGMHEGDAHTFSNNLGQAGLSTGTDLHNEVIRDIRGLLVNKFTQR